MQPYFYSARVVTNLSPKQGEVLTNPTIYPVQKDIHTPCTVSAGTAHLKMFHVFVKHLFDKLLKDVV